jgi:ATP-dependent Clp protease ATP-binding subunit ClpA
MTKGKGVLIHDDEISGYLIIGDDHFQIVGQRINKVRTHLDVHRIAMTETTDVQGDLFNEYNSSASGARKLDQH